MKVFSKNEITIFMAVEPSIFKGESLFEELMKFRQLILFSNKFLVKSKDNQKIALLHRVGLVLKFGDYKKISDQS